MPSTVSATRGTTTSLLNEVTTGTGASVFIPPNAEQVSFIARGTGVISSGTLIIEEAASVDYSGLWSQLESIDLSTLTGADEQQYHYNSSVGPFVRGRLGANVVGGGNVSLEVRTS
jgi:hypothetical protein